MSSSFWMTLVTSPSGPTGPATRSSSSPPVVDTFIKAVTQNMRLLGGHIRLASTGAASSQEGFFSYLKIYGTPVKSGTCANLIGLFTTNGYLFGKIADAECPPAP